MRIEKCLDSYETIKSNPFLVKSQHFSTFVVTNKLVQPNFTFDSRKSWESTSRPIMQLSTSIRFYPSFRPFIFFSMKTLNKFFVSKTWSFKSLIFWWFEFCIPITKLHTLSDLSIDEFVTQEIVFVMFLVSQIRGGKYVFLTNCVRRFVLRGTIMGIILCEWRVTKIKNRAKKRSTLTSPLKAHRELAKSKTN